METIEINLSEYYNEPKYYRFMPKSVFNALEAAFLAGEETAVVPKADFQGMLNDFNNAQS
jgi:hypothetical protein